MSKIFDCPQCHKQIGATEQVGNVELLHINGTFCREFRGFCDSCGTEIRYSVSDAALRALIEKASESVEVCTDK
jgi:Fe-S cluster biogenesis protein NfuA